MVESWLMQIILQIQLYVLYSHSKRVLCIVTLGFIIEIAATLVTTIRLSISEVNHLLSLTDNVTTLPASYTIDIYVGYSATLLYEFLLFSFALWAAIQCSWRRSNQIGARHLRVILIEGSVMYFLVMFLFLLVCVTVSLASP